LMLVILLFQASIAESKIKNHKSTFNIQHSTFNIQHSTFNIQHSTFNVHVTVEKPGSRSPVTILLLILVLAMLIRFRGRLGQ